MAYQLVLVSHMVEKILIKGFSVLPDAEAFPDEDMDMDLVAERQVLLSLPVEDRWFTHKT